MSVTSKAKIKKRFKSEIKLLKSCVNSWENRFADMEAKYEVSITSHATKISKMENKLKTLKTKLKIGNKKIKAMESKINDIGFANSEANAVATIVSETVHDDESIPITKEKVKGKMPKKKKVERVYDKLDADEEQSSEKLEPTRRSSKRTNKLQKLDVICKKVPVPPEPQCQLETDTESHHQAILEKEPNDTIIEEEENLDHNIVEPENESDFNHTDEQDYEEEYMVLEDEEEDFNDYNMIQNGADEDYSNSNELLDSNQNESINCDQEEIKIPDDITPRKSPRGKTTPLTPTPQIKCNFCPKVYYKQPALAKHMTTHKEHKKIERKCPLCDECIEEGQWSLKEHLKLHRESSSTRSLRKVRSSANGSGAYECQVCHIRFTRESHFKDHQKLHKNQGEEEGNNNINEDTKKSSSLKCPRCDRIFGNKSGFTKHFKICQKDASCYKCSQCERVFVRHDKLQAHLRCHTGETKTIQCTTCQKCFSRSDSLRIHIRSQHTERIRSFKCEKCQVSFYSPKGLRIHKKSKKHLYAAGILSPAVFECFICSQECSTNSGLIAHSKVHTKNQD